MDAQVARREDPKLAELLTRFVCVRAVEMEGVDLSIFQFDYDQSWHAFFLNADRTIYGRYGTRASGSADAGVDVSVPGLVEALQAALEVHAAYPSNKASLAGKRGGPLESRDIRGFDLFKSRFAEEPPRGCAHCHHVWEAVRSTPRLAKKPLPDALMWPYPKPDRFGLTLDLDRRATVKSVAAGSAAERAGFRAGDSLRTLAGQPILSIADVQWVTQWAVTPCDLAADVVRADGSAASLTLRLEDGWRRGEDVTWRPSTHAIRPFGWIVATPEQRRALKLGDDVLCARVGNVPNGGVAMRAGVPSGAFLVEVDGSDRPLSENEWLAYLQQKKTRGQAVTLTVLSRGKREKIRMQAP